MRGIIVSVVLLLAFYVLIPNPSDRPGVVFLLGLILVPTLVAGWIWRAASGTFNGGRR